MYKKKTSEEFKNNLVNDNTDNACNLKRDQLQIAGSKCLVPVTF